MMERKERNTSRYTSYLGQVTSFYQKKKVKIYTNLILSLLTISFFAFFAIRPTLVTITSLLKEIEDQGQVSQKLDEKLDDLATAQKNYAQVKADLPLIEETLPPTSEVAYFLGQLEILAQENRLNLHSVQASAVSLKGETKETNQKKTAKDIYPALNISLSLSGSYENLQNFLRAVSELRRIAQVNTPEIGQAEQDGSRSLNLTIEVETYYLSKAS